MTTRYPLQDADSELAKALLLAVVFTWGILKRVESRLS